MHSTPPTHTPCPSQLAASARPQLHLHTACHSRLQELVGSNLAKVVAFNLGYLPGALAPHAQLGIG
jgi:hypothetical protein